MGLLQRNHSYQAKILSGISLALAIASTQMGRGLIVPLGMDTGRPQERIGRWVLRSVQWEWRRLWFITEAGHLMDLEPTGSCMNTALMKKNVKPKLACRCNLFFHFFSCLSPCFSFPPSLIYYLITISMFQINNQILSNLWTCFTLDARFVYRDLTFCGHACVCVCYLFLGCGLM